MVLDIGTKLSKRLVVGLGILVILCLVSFNAHSLYRDGPLMTLEAHHQHTYLVVIGSPVTFASRRNLIRSTYFGIDDNLDPISSTTAQPIEYAFCIYGDATSPNTPERRAFETEKMEYNDIYSWDSSTQFTETTVLDWIKHQKSGKQYDFIIIQDIHSFIPLERLVKKIEAAGQVDKTLYWGDNEQGLVIGSQAQTKKGSFNSQVWKNSIESTDLDSMLLVTYVYQDQDFQALATAFGSKPVSMTKMVSKKAIVTSSYIYDKCMEPSATKASLNKRDYADKHGYVFISRSREFAQQSLRADQRRTVWGKIDVIEKVLPKFDWIMWLDMDAVIMNSNQTIEALLTHLKAEYYNNGTEFEDNIDFIIVRPGTDKMINAGVFLIKNTHWSFKFLREIQAREEWYRQGPSYEQGAMWDVMRQPENIKRTLYLDRENHIFNTFPKFYRDGDFVVHFAPDKCPNAATLKGLAAADRIYQGQKVTFSQLL
ncbi:galactosyl transferase GMA12/MNN10 family-domain-containing protein [Helicostylum pulchrum]|nr:galactosyl transferase GMA12/MNN10 family-domain-containing protein [Helicostylum pulchrum]